MRPPPPLVVIVILMFLALSNLGRAQNYSGSYAAGYLFATIFFPGLLALVYVRWYRRRGRPRS